MTRTTAILEALVDVTAIVALVVLASLRVVDGITVLPLITLVAGGSIGARVSARNRLPRRKSDDSQDAPPPSGGVGGHVSILALALLPLLSLTVSQIARVVVVAAVFGLALAGCGQGSTLPDTLWRLTRGACSVVVAIPEGTPVQAEPGTKVVQIDALDGGAAQP